MTDVTALDATQPHAHTADDAATPEQEAHRPAKKPPFPTATGRERGYDRALVEEFLARARTAFEADVPRGVPEISDEQGVLTADDVREVGFPLVKGGYRVEAVDAALGRIEEAFAARKRQRAIDAEGAEAWVDAARADAQEILDRLARPARARFDRVGVLSFGYDPAEVDAVADRVTAYLESGDPLTADQVRQAAFRMSRRGYREEQVDALLDDVVRVILAVR